MPRSAWCRTHGTSATIGRVVASEPWARDGLSTAASKRAPAASDHDEHGHFTRGNRYGRLAKSRAGKAGHIAKLDAKADKAWQAARRWGKRYAKHRIQEVAQSHGGELSAGVCALLQDEGALRADARYLQARAAADNNPELLRVAAALIAQARQAARDAWELAVREAETRPRKPNERWLRPSPSEKGGAKS